MDVPILESSASEVTMLLHGFSQSQYVALFEEHGITLEVLLSMTLEDIKEIGVEDDHDCHCIAEKIQEFKNIRMKNHTQKELNLTFSQQDAMALCTNTLKQLSLLHAALAYTRIRLKTEGVRNMLVDKLTTASVIEDLCKDAETQNGILLKRIESLHTKLKTKPERLLNKKQIGIVTTISTAVAVLIFAVYRSSKR
ncbi:uncharacterized protein LOC111062150 [Nilaparvata lugens]|uniref:uncharacterized protein LOC111062150 n=1 Tax=Nilaparvata lugens TaxID=108931 RepID=UPI000B9983AB|nr:uncharacterized protein LOC111062150 [Nilaparvata lugens]XP_039278157.1 uncharacterized protein LOC111062150 [Nilaparvata lugens]